MLAALPASASASLPRPWASARPYPFRPVPGHPSPARSAGARRGRGQRAHALGLGAEAAACAALERDGWQVYARRLRTPAGEIDIAAERDGVLALIEVKARPTLAEAAASLGARQQARLLAAAECVLASHPDWGRNGMRFDLIVADAAGGVRRIADAFRQE
ncbi:MAG: YraN family protein [Proteobacteria bacterium]|nr:YraN family protein [Pseudomonadota bacterium]